MKKKSLALALSLALIAVVGIGSTFAYFTDNDTKTNVVTMGHVDISLHEHEDGKTEEVEELKFTNIVPNEVVVKNADVRVENGSEDCYVRVKVEFEGLDKFSDKPVLTTADGWKLENDGFYHYYEGDAEKVLSVGDYDFLESVTMPNWDNAAADKTFSIILSAEAVQANFNKDENGNVEWPTSLEYVAPAPASASN